jgi:uncharacterized membrane protein
VRSELGRAVSNPRAIEVRAEGGVVRLFGDVLAEEASELVRCASKVRGVRAVEDHLARHASAEDVPSLQGTPRPPRNGRESWSPALRLGVGAAGVAATAYGISCRGTLGSLMLGTGLTALLRAGSDLSFSRLFGVGAGTRAIDIQKTLHIERPVEEVFAFFENLENFPRFMSHLKAVRVDGQRSHWVLDGPAHIPLSWDSELVRVEPYQLIAWRSVEGSLIKSSGFVRFERDDIRRTRLQISMSYNPPAGAIGHAVAKLFATDPKRLLDEDLLRLKSLLETGRATAHRREVTLTELCRLDAKTDASSAPAPDARG